MGVMLDAAMAYVEHGFRVFPVKPDKKPLTEHGLKDATQFQIGVKEYWSKWPDAGIGLVTDGLVVLDFDVKNNGFKSKELLEKKYGTLPATRIHLTGGGGLHYIYKNPDRTNIKNTVGFAGFPGVDIRANGGYIVVPPSPHESGKQYEVLDDSPIALAPAWLLVLARTKSTPVFSGDSPPLLGDRSSPPIPEGQRNATLARLAGAMRRPGMTLGAMTAALLEENQARCQPPLPEADVKRIAASISRYQPEDLLVEDEEAEQSQKLKTPPKTEKHPLKLKKGLETVETEKTEITEKKTEKISRGKFVWQMVDRWLEEHTGETFDLDTVCRHLNFQNPLDRSHVSKKLNYEVFQQKLEKSDRLYIYINKTIVSIDWLNASTCEPLAVSWPCDLDSHTQFGFDGQVVVSSGDIIVIAGVSNMGKTAFCLNFLWNNMDTYPCTLMGNEYEAGKFKRRVSKMDWCNPITEDGKPKFELIQRYDRWKDIIRPDNINIIDWINLSDNFYQIGSIIQGIKSKLKNGIAVISLQKSEAKSLGLGGGFSEHLASFYLLIDFERLTVKKCKEYYGDNPNGKVYGFSLTNGVKFENIRELQKCRGCGGSGRGRGDDCDTCEGKGYIDAL